MIREEMLRRGKWLSRPSRWRGGHCISLAKTDGNHSRDSLFDNIIDTSLCKCSQNKQPHGLLFMIVFGDRVDHRIRKPSHMVPKSRFILRSVVSRRPSVLFASPRHAVSQAQDLGTRSEEDGIILPCLPYLPSMRGMQEAAFASRPFQTPC